MKLTEKEASQFYNIISTCVQAGIEEIVFQDKTICAASAMRLGYCGIIVRNEVPPLPQKMGLTRLSTLKKRLDLLVGNNLEITPKESERGEIVQLGMVAGKTKTQYRCTSSITLKAPSEISDGGLTGLMTIKKEELSMVLSAIRAFGAKEVIMIIKAEGTVTFEVTDSTDRFSVELEAPIDRVSEDAPNSAVFYYVPDIFSNLLRAAIGTSDSLSAAVGISGTIQFELNNCEMSLFAQIDGGT
jgi:hypothetical protein